MVRISKHQNFVELSFFLNQIVKMELGQDFKEALNCTPDIALNCTPERICGLSRADVNFTVSLFSVRLAYTSYICVVPGFDVHISPL